MSDIVSELSRNSVPLGYNSPEQVDETPGLYCFWVRGKCLYAGMSINLRRRLRQHCTVEDNPILKDHFEAYGDEIRLSLVYKNASESTLRMLESYAILKLHPIANRDGNA